MTLRRAYLVAALSLTAFGIACTLNPQPLPPTDQIAPSDGGAFGGGDAARGASSAPETATNDAGDSVNADASHDDDASTPVVNDAGDDASIDANGDADSGN